jgi:hypothetical protein
MASRSVIGRSLLVTGVSLLFAVSPTLGQGSSPSAAPTSVTSPGPGLPPPADPRCPAPWRSVPDDALGPGRSDCVLPAWDPAGSWPFADIPPVEGFFAEDEQGDAADPGIDIIGVGFARVDLPEGGAIAAVGPDAEGLTVLGSPDAAGTYLVIHLTTAGLPGPLDGRAAEFGIAADPDGKARNDRPATVTGPSDPLAGSQQIHEIILGEDGTTLGATDFARKPVKGSMRFNASGRADFLVLFAPEANGITIVAPLDQVGEWFRPVSSRAAASATGHALAILVAGDMVDDEDDEDEDEDEDFPSGDWAGDGDRPLRTNGDSAGAGTLYAEVKHKPVTIPKIKSPPTGKNVHTGTDYRAPAQVVVYDCEPISEEEAKLLEAWFAKAKAAGEPSLVAFAVLEGEGPPFEQQIPVEAVIERKGAFPVLYLRMRIGVSPSGLKNLRSWEMETLDGLEDLLADKEFSLGFQLWLTFMSDGAGGLIGSPDPFLDITFD